MINIKRLLRKWRWAWLLLWLWILLFAAIPATPVAAADVPINLNFLGGTLMAIPDPAIANLGDRIVWDGTSLNLRNACPAGTTLVKLRLRFDAPNPWDQKHGFLFGFDQGQTLTSPIMIYAGSFKYTFEIRDQSGNLCTSVDPVLTVSAPAGATTLMANPNPAQLGQNIIFQVPAGDYSFVVALLNMPFASVDFTIQPAPTVTATLTANPSPAIQGQPITFTLTNTSSTIITLPDACTYTITDAFGTVVYNPKIAGFSCPAVTVTLNPRQATSWSWKQVDNAGNPVPPGNYTFTVPTLLGTSFSVNFTINPTGGPTTALLTVTPNPAPQGQPLTFTFTNTSSTTIILPSGAPWEVWNALGIVVARGVSPAAPQGVQPVVTLPILPGQAVSWTWDQRDTSGVQVPAGNYTVVVPTVNAGSFSAPFTILGAPGPGPTPVATISVDRGCLPSPTATPYIIGDPIVVSYSVTAGASSATIYDFSPATEQGTGAVNTIPVGAIPSGVTQSFRSRITGATGIETIVLQAQTSSGVVTAACSFIISSSAPAPSLPLPTLSINNSGCDLHLSPGSSITISWSIDPNITVKKVRIFNLTSSALVEATPTPAPTSNSGTLTGLPPIGPTLGDRMVVLAAITQSGFLTSACRYSVP